MRNIVILAAAALLLSGSAWAQANIKPDPTPRVPPQPGQILPVEDRLFLQQAAEISNGQVELGRLAMEKAPNQDFRTVAERIAGTHTKLAAGLKQLAGSRALPLGEHLSPERTDAFGAAGAVSNPDNAHENRTQDYIGTLQILDEEAFGKTYVEAQLRLHRRMVDLYQTQSSHSPDRELAAFAITSLVDIQRDRDALYQMAERFGIQVDADGQPIQYGNPAQAR